MSEVPIKKSRLKHGHPLLVSKPKIPKMYSLRKCEVRVKNLKISKKQNRVKHLKKCRVDLDTSDCKNYIKQYQAKQILSLLEKLENESNIRAKILKERIGKVNKTRNSLAYVNTNSSVNLDPETPQAEFLGNFNLKPHVGISKSVILKPDKKLASNKLVERVCDVQPSKDSDVDSGMEDARSEYSAPEPHHHHQYPRSPQSFHIKADLELIKGIQSLLTINIWLPSPSFIKQ